MPTATIAGLGLIGGAVGIALRRAGWRVLFVDPHVSDEDARRVGAADARAERSDDADVLIVATPVDVARELVRDAPGVVTSVCSVMAPLRAVGHPRFVAGHPMAGHHESGLANAHRVVLENAAWFLDGDLPIVNDVVRACGAEVIRVDAAQHDAAVALTSHLPQVLSTALFAHLSGQPDVSRFAGAGLRSFRLAASDGAMWHSVLEANRDNLRPHADAIAQLVRAIIEGDDPEAFARARTLWRSLQR
jgi:prephenate dehydrogenase